MQKRSYTHLSFEERETLSLGQTLGQSLRAMATVLGRSPSTLSRNGPVTLGRCLTVPARRRRKLLDRWRWRYVVARLRRGFSPEQIAGRLRRDYPHAMNRRLSPETIYAARYMRPRGALRRELLIALRQARRPRSRGADRRGQIPNRTPIALRPAEVAARLVPGHWEGDLIKGAGNASAVGSLVERTSRLVVLARLDGTGAVSARRGFAKKLRRVPVALRKTLTYDRGKEMAEHERLAQRLSIRVFFADPHSPWQRGTNENTNGLLRQYLPKGTDLSVYTRRELNAIAYRLNGRPRKCLDWATPLGVCKHLRHHSTVALGT